MPRKRRSSSPFDTFDDDFDDDADSQSSRSGNPPIQRNAANARERARMRVLSSAFGRLKTKLPNIPADTKLSKLDTLRLATMYIKQLKTIVEGGVPSGDNFDCSLVMEQGGLFSLQNGTQSMTWPFGFHHIQNNNNSSSISNNNNNNNNSSRHQPFQYTTTMDWTQCQSQYNNNNNNNTINNNNNNKHMQRNRHNDDGSTVTFAQHVNQQQQQQQHPWYMDLTALPENNNRSHGCAYEVLQRQQQATPLLMHQQRQQHNAQQHNHQQQQQICQSQRMSTEHMATSIH